MLTMGYRLGKSPREGVIVCQSWAGVILCYCGRWREQVSGKADI